MPDPTELQTQLQLTQQRVAELMTQLQAQAKIAEEKSKLAEEQARTLLAMQESREQLQQEKASLQLLVDKLTNQLYGNRRERFMDDPNQLKIDFGDDPQAEDMFRGAIEEARQVMEQVESRRAAKKPRKQRNERLPEHLPRVDRIMDVPAAQKQCVVHGEKQVIGYDTTEKLMLKRPELYVLRTRYPKYACTSGVKADCSAGVAELTVIKENSPEPELPPKSECGVVQAERPTGLVEGDRYDTSVAAEIVVQKYGYHLPFYRQQDWFATCGWVPSRSMLLNILIATEFVLQPLARYYRQLLLQSRALGVDETTVKLIVPSEAPAVDPKDPRSQRMHEVLRDAIKKKHPTVSARMWAYRAIDLPINVFDFTVSRHRDGPDEVLANYHGSLMGDCWTGFKQLAMRTGNSLERAACWAHARRKVFDGCKSHPQLASELLSFIRALYDIEDRGKCLEEAARLELRQRESTAILKRIQQLIDEPAYANVLPKSAMGEALTYLRRNWDALQLYASRGLLPIDNNDVEQLMKQVALGRKNWLFIGSVAAGNRAANLLSIISTAVRNDLDTWAYLKDVLDQLLAGSTDYESMRADKWKVSHPEHVRTYREEERQEASDRRRYERASRRLASPSTPSD